MVSVGELAALVKAGNLDADRELTRLAARGDFQAQRELLTILIGDPEGVYGLMFSEVARLELLARFVALRGNALDVRRLAAVLWQMGRTALDCDPRRKLYAAEAVELLRELADGGDGVANEHLAALAADFPDAWEVAEMCEAATPSMDQPPPIVRMNIVSGETLGDILASALEQRGQQPIGLLVRLRRIASEWAWRVRLRWWDFKDHLMGWGK